MMKQKTLKNRTIFCRDNLEVLRGIDSNSIDLIYLDPPFNKKRQFTAPIGSSAEGASFHDYFREGDMKEEWLGLIAEENPALYEYIHGIGKVGHKSNKYYVCYMAVRLIELHRVLKGTGSLYLHCDTTMSHFLKLLLDCIFGEDNFRNEVIWNYGGRGGKAIAQQFPRNHDVLLWYGKSASHVFNRPHTQRKILFKDSGYRLDEQGRCFRTAPRGHYTDESVKRLTAEGRIFKTRTGSIRIKYFEDYDGTYVYEKKLVGDTWHDIPDAMHMSVSEKTNYPTQKPLKLLERIIKASSNKGDIVLDPFCGCATTCVAAEKLERQWVGIDVSEKAYQLVQIRLNKEVGRPDELFSNKIIYRTDIPERTDTEAAPEKLNKKHYLYGKQEGVCAGCDVHFSIRNLTIDHIVPTSKGGGKKKLGNLQLLCGNCNSIKGNRDMPYLKSRLKELKILA